MLRLRLFRLALSFSLTLLGVWGPAVQIAVSQDDAATRQTEVNEGDQAWARKPRDVVFQNDSQWEDNRLQATLLGPFQSSTIRTAKGLTLKGIAIQVGSKRQAAVCFDSAMLRMSAGWTGGFLQFGPRRFGLIEHPKSGGRSFFSTPNVAGWAKGVRFEPRPEEKTLVEVERGYTADGTSVTHLPRDWAAYRGLYLSGDRVVLSYTVGNADVLESPWFVESEQAQAFTRTLEVAPSDTSMRMLVADETCQVIVVNEANADSSVGGNVQAEIQQAPQGTSQLVIPPHDRQLRLKLLIVKQDLSERAVTELKQLAGAPEDLRTMIESDKPRWPQMVETVGETSRENATYVIDTLTLPFENPYKSLLFTAGHDFFSNGDCAVSMAHGDVWVVSGIDRNLKQLKWKRFATGLFQPLGLKIVDDTVYVIGKDQVTRLYDRNQDGEADYYENFNNDQFICPRTHDYVTCLDTDPDGNFYFIHAKTGVMRVAKDGSSMSSVADGFRNPNGMAVGPNGWITAAPQQGGWTPESSLILVKEGGYYGFGGPRVTPDRPTGWDLPMCFIPRALDNSGGGQVWVEGDRWGPLNGQMLHLSYGRCRVLLALPEQVGDVYQGGTIEFPTAPADFESGVMRGRFSPHDGQLYLSGLRGWQTTAIRDGCLQRVRYTGGEVNLPVQVKTFKNGIQLKFTDPLDRSMAENPENFFVEQWNYQWTSAYGSPEFSVESPQEQKRDEVTVVSATLLDDERTLFLEMPNREIVMQLAVSWFLKSKSGATLQSTYAHTINAAPKDSFPESRIVRRSIQPRVAAEVESRLAPGLAFSFQRPGEERADVRISRLAALNQPLDRPVSPFLPPGPFAAAVEGTLKIPMSGFYQFRFQPNTDASAVLTGRAKLWINDELLVESDGQNSVTQKLLINRGHNRIRVEYSSPSLGDARFHLQWKGYNFDWEPLSPALLFHDSASTELKLAKQRRKGRELFATNHCQRCHETGTERPAMFEANLDPPNLANASERFTRPWLIEWLLRPGTLRSHDGQHPGRMPAVLGHGADSLQEANDIAAYLLDGQENTAAEPAQQDDALIASGEALYEQQGCISCHHFGNTNDLDPYGRLSLQAVNSKFVRGALAEFLQDPRAHYPATRMPDFQLKEQEARQLAAYLRSVSKEFTSEPLIANRALAAGNAQRGEVLFRSRGCQSCHAVGTQTPIQNPRLGLVAAADSAGCLSTKHGQAPDYALSQNERELLRQFIDQDLGSLEQVHPMEASQRLFGQLRCAACHDRDGVRSQRVLVIAEEGSGQFPEVLPQLTWAGEKFQSDWLETLLRGNLTYKSRPWVKARMPAFPAYAKALTEGFAHEHAMSAEASPPVAAESELVAIGEKLTLQSGLDCRQCHAIGDLQPRGDKDTQINIGINFTYIRDRLRRESYDRFMIDPPRYDINTKMIRLSVNGRTTKLKEYFDADAHQQFGAIWHYIQSLPQ